MRLTDLFRWLLPLAFLRLSFGGDGGDSSQSSSTTNVSTTNTTDRRSVADGSGVIVGDGSSASVSNTSTVTDLGAIKAGTELSQAALLGITKLATDAQARAGALSVSSLDAVGNVVYELKGAYASANEQAQAVASGNKTLAIVGMIIAGVFALGYINKGKK